MRSLKKRVDALVSKTHIYISQESLRLVVRFYQEEVTLLKKSERYEENLQRFRESDEELAAVNGDENAAEILERGCVIVHEDPAVWYAVMSETFGVEVKRCPDGKLISADRFKWLVADIRKARRWATQRTKK